VKLVLVNRYFFPDHSATSQLLSDLAVALCRTHEVVVVTSRQRYDNPLASLAPRDSVGRVRTHRVWTTCFGRTNLPGRAVDYLTFYFTAGIALWRILEPGDVVVAMTDPPLISVVAALACRMRGAKLVNWLQDLFPEVAEALGTRWVRGPAASCLRWLRNGSLRAAEANIVLGECTASRVEAQGVPKQSIRVIPNWANGAHIRPIDARASPIRREWSLLERFVVSYSGNMGRVHEFDTILQAARLIQAAEAGRAGASPEGRKRTMFVFIGGGAQRDWIERKGRRLGLSELAFKPYQPREALAASLGAADVHLASLRPELEGLSFPSKLYGILAAGRPVVFVGAEDGAVGQFVRRENVGFVVKPGEDAELADVLMRLRDDESLRLGMGRRARRVFEAQFDFPIAAKRFGEVLKSPGSLREAAVLRRKLGH
jgi:glycosyltransferase involved in cell wall biosynthesis